MGPPRSSFHLNPAPFRHFLWCSKGVTLTQKNGAGRQAPRRFAGYLRRLFRLVRQHKRQ